MARIVSKEEHELKRNEILEAGNGWPPGATADVDQDILSQCTSPGPFYHHQQTALQR
jgi:hypothetical protein